MQAAAGPLGGEEFANRLRKNLKHLGKWARRNDITNYRVYDADLPEYAIAVDLYVAEGELHAYQHDGFFQPMDTVRDKAYLEELWATGEAPWKRW